IHKYAEADLRGSGLHNPPRGQTPAAPPGPARVRDDLVAERPPGKARLEYFDRRDPAVSVDVVLGGIAVRPETPAPAARFEVIIRVVLVRLRMHPAEEKVAAGHPFRCGNTVRDRLGEG